MPWFRVDDSFHTSRKVFELRAGKGSDAAIALWVMAGAWAAQQNTEGFVPISAVSMLGKAAAAKALVRVGLWEAVPGGYRFHDWTDYQPTKAEVESQRKRNRDKVRAWRARQRSDPPESTHVTGYTQPDVTDNVTGNEPGCTGSIPVPSRPVPSWIQADGDDDDRRSNRQTGARVGVGAVSSSSPSSDLTAGYRPTDCASSGHLDELDTIRREVEAKFGKKIGPLSLKRNDQKSGLTVTMVGVARAIDGYGWECVRDVTRYVAEQAAIGAVSSTLWAHMFSGDGFRGWAEACEAALREREAPPVDLSATLPTPEDYAAVDAIAEAEASRLTRR